MNRPLPALTITTQAEIGVNIWKVIVCHKASFIKQATVDSSYYID